MMIRRLVQRRPVPRQRSSRRRSSTQPAHAPSQPSSSSSSPSLSSAAAVARHVTRSVTMATSSDATTPCSGTFDTIVHLSHSCTLLKPFAGFKCHLAVTLPRSSVRWGFWAPDLQRKGRFGIESSSKICNCKLQQTVSPKLLPGEYKRGVAWTAIPLFAKYFGPRSCVVVNFIVIALCCLSLNCIAAVFYFHN